MLKKQVIQQNFTSGFNANVIGVDQNYTIQQGATTYGTMNGAHRLYEIKDNLEDEEQTQKRKVDDQMKFNARNPIEYQNELKVQDFLEQKAQQQLMNLCGGWDQQVRRRIQLELDIIPSPLLGLFKWLIILTLLDLLWVTFSSLCMPTAGMHFIEDYVTSNIRWQMFIYWFSNLFQWLCLTLMFAKLTILMCRAAIITILLNLAWHVGNFVFYYSFNSSRQRKFPISNPIIYWVESILSLSLLLACIVMYQRLDAFVKTNPDRALVLNKNMGDIIKEQYIMKNQMHNLPISQMDQQQGSILQEMSQPYSQAIDVAVVGSAAGGGITLKNNYPMSHRSQVANQNQSAYNKESRRDLAGRMNQSILNETDTNFLNQTNGNINYTGLYSQQFLEQDRSLIIDEIQNEKTAVLSIYHHDWRTHYGEFAPDQKKRKIIDAQMVKYLEDDLKASRKIKMQGNIPQMYTYFDLHFAKQSPIGKNNNQQSPSKVQQSPRKIQQSPSRVQLSPSISRNNQSPKRVQTNRGSTIIISQIPSNQDFDLHSLQNVKHETSQTTQQIKQQQQQLQQQNTLQNLQTQSNFGQSPNRKTQLNNNEQIQPYKLEQNFQSTSQYQTPFTQSPNIQAVKQRGQTLSFYGEASLGFNQLNKEINQNVHQDETLNLDHSVSHQDYSKTQNQFNNQHDTNRNKSTTQNFNQNYQKRTYSFNQEDYESEYFKTKAILGDINSNKKKRWGISTIQQKQSNIKTFENNNQ